MADRPINHDGERPTGDLAPELDNSQQADQASQTQEVAADALARNTSVLGLEDSEKVPGGIEDFDAPDLVDTMNQMVSSGRIDNSAFEGEPDHDGEGDDIRLQVNGGRAISPDDAEDVDEADELAENGLSLASDPEDDLA